MGSTTVNTHFAIAQTTMVNYEEMWLNLHIDNDYLSTTAEYQQVFVRCVDDSFITCRLNPKEGALHQLNCQVFAKTGIPPNTQQFIAGTKLVTSSADIAKR